jgi:hypothetical protein
MKIWIGNGDLAERKMKQAECNPSRAAIHKRIDVSLTF